jgi:two-component system, OmpR family, sensor histidine kinase TctE
LRHFTGNASHQLRTPMAIVRTQLALAERSGDREAQREAIAAADAAVAHAERILAQLLVLARIDEAASDQQGQAEIDLAALARMQTAEHVPAANEVGIDLGYEGDEVVLVRGDAMLMSEMIRNLIENALAYAGAGAEATVAVRSEAGSITLSVADNGAGVAAEKLPQVLERFGRQRTDKPGAGLGLAIVKEIASLFGGTMSVESDTGKGFKATIRFAA